jgi:putative ABC transport system permease protein
MLLSIVLSSTLLFVSMSIGDCYEKAQQKMAKGMAGVAAISVSAKPDANGNPVWISEQEIPLTASIKSRTGIITAPALYSQNGHYENIDMIGADLNELNAINKPRLLDCARLADFTANSIILPANFTSKYGIEPGDDVALAIGASKYKFKLAAVAAYDTVFLRSTRGVNALLPKETLAYILNTCGGNSKILIEPAGGVSTDKLISTLSATLSPQKYNVTKVYDETQVAADARQKSLPFYLISFFSLTMCVFIIYSSYKVITLERLPVIGTFRSIGASEKMTTGIMLLESLLYGIAGGLVSIPLGYGVLKLILEGLGKSLALGIDIPMVVSPLNILLACMAAAVVSILSSFIPIRKASRLPIKDVVLGTVEEENISHKAKFVLGAVLFILSIILPRMVNKNSGDLLMLAGGFSLLGLIAATIIIIPIITDLFSAVLERVYGLVLGNEGRLAARNLKQNKNASRNVTLLFISLSAVIVISQVSSFLVTYIGDVFHGAQLNGFTQASMSTEFINEVKSIKGIYTVLPIYELSNEISTDGSPFNHVEAVDDLDLLNTMLNIHYDSSRVKKDIRTDFGKERNILLSKDYLTRRGLKIGDILPVTFQDKIYNYRIIGCFQSRADNSEAVIPAAYAKSDFGLQNYGMLAYTAADPDAAIKQIRNLFGNQPNWSRTIKEFNHDAMTIVHSFLDPMRKLTYFILLLAAVGVINNLLVNHMQRRHSIAMYKSVGMSNRQNIKITLIESITLGLFGAVTGIFVSYLEIGTIFIVAGPNISVTPELDTGIFVMAGLAGVAITMAGSVVPILKGAQMKLVEEIKFE